MGRWGDIGFSLKNISSSTIITRDQIDCISKRYANLNASTTKTSRVDKHKLSELISNLFKSSTIERSSQYVLGASCRIKVVNLIPTSCPIVCIVSMLFTISAQGVEPNLKKVKIE